MSSLRRILPEKDQQQLFFHDKKIIGYIVEASRVSAAAVGGEDRKGQNQEPKDEDWWRCVTNKKYDNYFSFSAVLAQYNVKNCNMYL